MTATELRTLAQYMLAASVQLQRGHLCESAEGLLAEWHKAAPHIKSLLGEYPISHAASVTRQAIGMLTQNDEARQRVWDEVSALLRQDEQVKTHLAEGEWAHAAALITDVAIDAYRQGLMQGQAS